MKDAVRLRDRRHREKQGRILIDGARELRRAIGAGVKLWKCSSASRCARATTPGACWPRCRNAAARCCTSAKPVFEKLAFGQRAEGVLGVAEMPRPTLESLLR